jgi:hypothetical protein
VAHAARYVSLATLASNGQLRIIMCSSPTIQRMFLQSPRERTKSTSPTPHARYRASCRLDNAKWESPRASAPFPRPKTPPDKERNASLETREIHAAHLAPTKYRDKYRQLLKHFPRYLFPPVSQHVAFDVAYCLAH